MKKQKLTSSADTSIHPALRSETVVVQLRALPRPVHHALRVEAMEEGVSLEQHIVRLLSLHILKEIATDIAKAVK